MNLLLPDENIKPPYDDPLLIRFANNALRKHNNFHFSVVQRFGNVNITSEFFNLHIFIS